VLPPDSSDARLIAENIAEARAALGAPGQAAPPAMSAPAVQTAKAAASAGVTLRGEVQLDPRWRGKVTPDTVLYIFAKAVGQPGPPVAVFRTNAARWPVTFVLDDSLAMMPGRNLSSASSVVVEARLSRSGSANPTTGDLRGATPALNPRATGALRVLINEEIG
jgi:cytochrome c-type biogenesis protein CcmH